MSQRAMPSNALLRHVDLCLRKGMPFLNGEFVITNQPVWTGVGRIAGTHISSSKFVPTLPRSGTDDDDDDDGNSRNSRNNRNNRNNRNSRNSRNIHNNRNNNN